MTTFVLYAWHVPVFTYIAVTGRWILIHLLLLHNITASNNLFTQKPLTKELGIYFEQVSSIRLYHKQWNIVTYVNLTSLQTEWDHIRDMVQKTEDICSGLRTLSEEIHTHFIQRRNMSVIENFNCGPTYIQLQNLMTQIADYNVEHFQNINNRRKRGFLNVVGEIAKDLFGTLSESDAQYYMNRINDLQAGNQQRDEIVRKQSTIIQSSFNLLAETRKQTQSNDEKLAYHVNEIQASMTTLRTDYNRFNNYITIRHLAVFHNIAFNVVSAETK